ncbi:uncharacterized protein [Paralichthys olivaceus]|uniref:uncharacterized protein n=1 Tax=Paralichthys olivaceus TaxID=8255 RepID=UPI003752C5A7
MSLFGQLRKCTCGFHAPKNLIFKNLLLGTSANSLNFQAYLLEGLHRWNQDRGSAALAAGPSSLRSYSGDLLHCVNSNYQKLFGRKVAPEFSPPSCYTGELIGVQYLFRQTGQALQDMHPDSEETAKLVEQHEVEDSVEEDEGFSDLTGDPTVLDLEVPQAPSSLTPHPSTTTSAVGSLVSSLASSVSSLAPSRSILVPATTTMTSATSTMTSATSTMTSATSTVTSATSTMTSATSTSASSTVSTGSSSDDMVSVSI